MKTAAIYRKKGAVPYPNAATRQEVFQKYLDTVLTFACCGGILAMLMFLMMIF